MHGKKSNTVTNMTQNDVLDWEKLRMKLPIKFDTLSILSTRSEQSVCHTYGKIGRNHHAKSRQTSCPAFIAYIGTRELQEKKTTPIF